MPQNSTLKIFGSKKFCLINTTWKLMFFQTKSDTSFSLSGLKSRWISKYAGLKIGIQLGVHWLWLKFYPNWKGRKSDTLNTSNPNLLPFGNVECGLRNRNQVDLTINTNRHVEIISPLEGWRFTNTTWSNFWGCGADRKSNGSLRQ